MRQLPIEIGHKVSAIKVIEQPNPFLHNRRNEHMLMLAYEGGRQLMIKDTVTSVSGVRSVDYDNAALLTAVGRTLDWITTDHKPTVKEDFEHPITKLIVSNVDDVCEVEMGFTTGDPIRITFRVRHHGQDGTFNIQIRESGPT